MYTQQLVSKEKKNKYSVVRHKSPWYCVIIAWLLQKHFEYRNFSLEGVSEWLILSNESKQYTVAGEYSLVLNKTQKIGGVINKKRTIIYFSAGLLK